MARVPSFLMVVVALISAIVLVPAVRAQSPAPAPAPAPTSDGVAIDQGIAYVLMLAALLLTYLIHPLDASSASDKLF
ncbi:arabinogalactan protein 41-like [Musa acuminata AAA Group]|uniref:arabinogalactan protein 41-like n=1 Tax=Musa acuminata AAA Group TaxID=214697 RepID=UPI0031D43E0B